MAEHPVEHPRLYLALAQAHELPREDAIRLLQTRRAAMATELAATVGLIAENSAVPEIFRLDGGMRVATLRAQIAWLEDLVERIDTNTIAWLDEALRDCNDNGLDGIDS